MGTENTNDIPLYETTDQCCACGACVNVCVSQAIQLMPDEKGFLYPQIDPDKCIKCEQCLEVCIYKHSAPATSEKETYVAVAEGIDIRKSASGGIFAGLATKILEQGGIVFGCTMSLENGKFIPRHISIDRTDELYKLQGSKYVQSTTEMTFKSAEEFLNSGRTVLYSGTPCQIAALKLFLGKPYDRLFTIDTICHGVPNAQLFNDYIAFESKKRQSTITGFEFRDKSAGWKLHGKMTLEKDGKTSKVPFEPEDSSYYQMFLNRYTYRDNCYSCPYASDHRPGDITIGDYWCIDLVHPELLSENGGSLEQTKGVSCLIINSPQGRKLMEEFGKEITTWPSTYENASKYNRQLLEPSRKPAEREEVFARYQNGYAEVDKWYQARLKPIRRKRAIRNMIPKGLKKTVKKLIR